MAEKSTQNGHEHASLTRYDREGRQKRVEEPELAARADNRELVVLVWKGGVDEKLKAEKKRGTLKYLATWQGLRGEDLDIALDGEQVIVCSKTGQNVVFNAKLPVEEEQGEEH